MTPEEVHQELADIKQMLLEIKAAFDRFTTEKKQHWKDEAGQGEEKGPGGNDFRAFPTH